MLCHLMLLIFDKVSTVKVYTVNTLTNLALSEHLLEIPLVLLYFSAFHIIRST